MLSCNRPVIKDIDILRIEEQLRSGNLAQGQKVADLEAKMEEIVGRESAAALSSATAAFEAVFEFIDLKEGDEVILSPLTFKSVPYSVIRSGATPVFIDTNHFFLPNWELVEDLLSDRTVAIITTSLYGMPDPNLNILMEALAYYPDIWIIEDDAQSIGAKWTEDRHIGSFHSRADFAIFSFYATKNIAAGEGGVIISDGYNDFFHMYRNNGICKNYLDKTCIGTNMRMTDIEATLALSQLERLDHVLKIRNNQADIYSNILSIPNLQKENLAPGSVHAFHHYTIMLPHGVDRVNIMSRLEESGIKSGIYYDYLANYDQGFRMSSRMIKTPNALDQSKRAICLPLGESLNHDDIRYIANKFEEILSSESAAG